MMRLEDYELQQSNPEALTEVLKAQKAMTSKTHKRKDAKKVFCHTCLDESELLIRVLSPSVNKMIYQADKICS